MIKGIDLSHYNSGVDFRALLEMGAAFAYLKATEGVNYVDPTFEARRAACDALGIPCGAYHFFRPYSDAMEQASSFCEQVLALHPGELPPAVDLEYCPLHEANGDQWDSQGIEATLNNIGAFCWWVEKVLGLKPVIYTSKSWWQVYTKDCKGFAEHPLWVAHYAPSAPQLFGGWSRWDFWQQGVVEGIDRDVFNGDSLPLFGVKP